MTADYRENNKKGIIGEIGGNDHPLGDLIAAATILSEEGIIEITSSLEAKPKNGLPQSSALRLEVFLLEGLDAIGDEWLEKLKDEGLEQGFYRKPK